MKFEVGDRVIYNHTSSQLRSLRPTNEIGIIISYHTDGDEIVRYEVKWIDLAMPSWMSIYSEQYLIKVHSPLDILLEALEQ